MFVQKVSGSFTELEIVQANSTSYNKLWLLKHSFPGLEEKLH